ncbi:metacaspase-like protein [Plasmodium malariae]|uniref:Metacaspase-like protein n=1 Tax=Plasmodium malariae TaxID=5858 RepID=A0A1C3KFJ3_PLAMA|nr:metacaspase-like protein [Plasmodium malariae]
MGNYDNININGSKKDDRRFTSSVKKSTSLKSSLICHEKKTKSYKLDKHSDEDKCKLNEKYASCKISNEKKKLLKSMKKVNTKGYCMDKFKTVSRNVECYNRMSKITHKGNSSKRAQTVSRKIARNSNNNANGSNSNSNSNSNSSNIRKIINLRRKELPSTLNSICSRPDNRRKSILKKDIHHYVEENVKKKNSDHDRVKNENSNSNEQITGKMIINKGSIDLLSTYNIYNGIWKQENNNKCLHDEHALNLLETKTSITTKSSIKNEDIQIKQNKLEQINKINCYERNINNSVNHNSVKRIKERSNSAKMTILPKFELSNPSRVATLSHISSRDMPRGNHSGGYRIYENHVNGIAEHRNVSSKRNSITAYRDVSCSSNVKEDMPNRHSDVLTNKYMSYLNKDCIIFLEKNRKMVNDNYIKGNFHNMLKYISHHNSKSDLVRKKGIHSIIEKGNENMHRNLLHSKTPDSIYEEGEVKFNCVKANTDDFNMQKGSYKYNKHFDHSEHVKPFKHLLNNSTSPIEMLNKELRTYKKYDHTDVDSKKNYTAKNFFISTNYDNFKKYSSLPNCSDNEIIANRYYTDNFYSKMLKNKNKDNLNGNTYSNCSRDFSRRKVINGKSHLKNGNYLESVNYVSCDKDINDPIKEENSLNFYDNSNYRINWNSLKGPNSYKNYYTYNDLSQQVFRKNIYSDARDVNTNEFYKSYNNVLDRDIKNGIIASKICNGDDMMVKDNNYYSHINMNCFRTSPLRSNKCNKYEHVHISPNVTDSSKIVLQQYAEDGNLVGVKFPQYAEDGNLVGVKFPQDEREIDNNNNNNKSNDDNNNNNNNNNNSNNNDNNKLNKSSVHIFKKIYIDHNLSNIQNRNEYNADRKDNSERNILSSYVPLNMEHKISKIDDERFIKYDKNYIHEKNDNIINEKRNQTNDYQKKYTISNNSSTDESQSSMELKKYAFNEATYLSHECVLEKGKIESNPLRNYHTITDCNYLNDVGGNRLYGSVNDAYIFCRALVKYFDFMPDNILLLTDSLPSNAYIYEDFDIDRKKYIKEEYIYANDEKKFEKNNFFNLFNKSSTYDKEKINTKMIDSNSCRNVDIKNVDFSSENISFNLWPTRINILKAVNWLVRDSAPFGSYVFYFAGKSVQVDNMSGWEGEGYDEAFLCSDPFSRNYAHNVITTVQLKDLLLSINISAQMTIILDCSGGQTILDPAGTENSLSYIKGCKQKGIWPIANPTNKVHKAVYDITILNHISMKKYFCKSRYSKLIEVESTSAMIDPLLQSISSLPVAPKAYCLCAATWEQTSIEGLFPTVEFARVTQIKPMIDLEQVGKNKKINEKKIGNKCEVGKNKHKKILSNVHKLGTEKKSIYEKNFSFSLNVMKLFFNNSTSGINNNSTNYNKDYDKMRKDEEENAGEKKIKHSSLHDDNDNNVKHAVSNECDDSDYSVNTTSNEEIFNNCKGKDNYVLVSHGVFTYCLIEAIIEFKEIELKNNIFEQRNAKFLPMTLKNLINVIQKKIQNVKNNKLKKLDQKPEFTIHPGANASTNNYFVHYSKNIHFQNYKCDFMHSDLSPFLNVNKAWEEINKNTLKNRKSLSVTSTLINTASSKYFTAESNKIKNSYSLRC